MQNGRVCAFGVANAHLRVFTTAASGGGAGASVKNWHNFPARDAIFCQIGAASCRRRLAEDGEGVGGGGGGTTEELPLLEIRLLHPPPPPPPCVRVGAQGRGWWGEDGQGGGSVAHRATAWAGAASCHGGLAEASGGRSCSNFVCATKHV
jgi:hypothetical protein